MISTSSRCVLAASLVALAALSSACAATTPGPAAPPPPPIFPGASACAVWDREVDFARSVQTHDARAFAEHIHPGATFVEGDTVLRGPAAVTSAWKELLLGEKVRIDWHPSTVVLSGDQRLALSRGPYLIERMKEGANPRFLTGTYQSVWQLGDDGVWRVTVDGGTPAPATATDEDVVKVRAAFLARCPTG